MARLSYIPHDQDREDQKAEEKAERKRAFKEPAVNEPTNHPRFGELDPLDDDFASVEDFAEALYEDERTEYTAQELQCLNFRTGWRVQEIRAFLAEQGFELEVPRRPRNVRGFTANCHNRWVGFN